MHRISLTDFVDIVSASGTSKASKIRAVKYRPPYTPARDYYKSLREHIAETHRIGESKPHLESILPKTSRDKIPHFKSVIDGYKKWWGKQSIEWNPPVSTSFSLNDIEISINPELLLSLNNTKHVIKLYFKPDKLSKQKTAIITQLMSKALTSQIDNDTIPSILDIRASKLLDLQKQEPLIDSMIEAETGYIATIWDSV